MVVFDKDGVYQQAIPHPLAAGTSGSYSFLSVLGLVLLEVMGTYRFTSSDINNSLCGWNWRSRHENGHCVLISIHTLKNGMLRRTGGDDQGNDEFAVHVEHSFDSRRDEEVTLNAVVVVEAPVVGEYNAAFP